MISFMTNEKNPAAVALGRMGGNARVKKQTAKERTDSASKAAKARWKNHKSKKSKR